MSNWIPVSFCLVTTLLASTARADGPAHAPSLSVAVQERETELKHELSLGLGVLPLDAYYKGVSAQLGYTRHFSDRFAWQVGRATYSYNVSTQLRRDLESGFGAGPEEFREVRWIAGSDLMWKPLYGKTAGLDRSALHFEAFLLGGASLVGLSDGLAPAAHVGVGARVFTGRSLSFRVDATDHLIVKQGLLNAPSVLLSAAWNFGGEEPAMP